MVVASAHHCPDCLRVPRFQFGIPADPARLSGHGKSCHGPLPDQRPLQLPDSSQNLERELPLRCSGVRRVAQRPKSRTTRLQRVDHCEEMRYTACQSIDADHGQYITWLNPLKKAGEGRALIVAARGRFRDELGGAGST